MRYSLLGILGFAVMLVACTHTVSAPKDDESSEISSSSKKVSSSESKESKKGSSSSSGKLVKSSSSDKTETAKSSSSASDNGDCVGESGEPWDGTTAKDFACGAGTKLSPYIILTAEQLAHLSFVVNSSDKAYQGKYFKLGADIKLNKGDVIDDKGALVGDSTKLHKWTPIGNSSVVFDGNFDGDGHSVSGMFINTTSTHNGLFGNSSGTVQNLIVENSWVQGGGATAGIIGNLKGNGSLRNSVNKASVIGTGTVTGGVIGSYESAYDKKGLVENVENQGAVTGLKNVGGIIGTASSIKISGARNYAEVVGSITVGGIAASLGSNSELKNGSNFAKITGKEYTAGIVGFFGNSYCPASANYGIMQNVLNRGEVTGTNYIAGVVGQALCVTIMESANTDSIIGDKYLAGIIGHAKRSNVESIYNKGAVFGSTNVGGIIGYNEEGVTSSAYSTGKVDGDSLVGLMIGYNYNTTMADYYYLEQGDQEPFGLNNGGGVATPKAADEMKSDDFAELLGDEFTYDSDLNDGYPVLKWEME